MPSVYRETSAPEYYVNIDGVYTVINLSETTVREESTTYTILLSDGIILGDASGGAFTMTLPTAASAINKVFHVKKIDSSVNAVTVDGNGAETIDGGANAALSAQYESIMIVSDGTEWHVI